MTAGSYRTLQPGIAAAAKCNRAVISERPNSNDRPSISPSLPTNIRSHSSRGMTSSMSPASVPSDKRTWRPVKHAVTSSSAITAVGPSRTGPARCTSCKAETAIVRRGPFAGECIRTNAGRPEQ